jgi:hypothetical protein
MGDYMFSVTEIFAEPYSATPQLTARVRIEETTGQPVHAMVLRCQVRIEPKRRGYSEEDETGLRALFGDRERWKETMRPFLWMQCNTTVQGFTGDTVTDLSLPCTYDFEVAGSKFLHAVSAGTIPLSLMFSGTIFTRGGENGFGVEQVPWDRDARYDLPVSVWQDMMHAHFPNQGWIKLDQDVLDEFADYRARHGLTSWDETVKVLLASQKETSR